jgi:hypothetical protein
MCASETLSQVDLPARWIPSPALRPSARGRATAARACCSSTTQLSTPRQRPSSHTSVTAGATNAVRGSKRPRSTSADRSTVRVRVGMPTAQQGAEQRGLRLAVVDAGRQHLARAQCIEGGRDAERDAVAHPVVQAHGGLAGRLLAQPDPGGELQDARMGAVDRWRWREVSGRRRGVGRRGGCLPRAARGQRGGCGGGEEAAPRRRAGRLHGDGGLHAIRRNSRPGRSAVRRGLRAQRASFEAGVRALLTTA